MLKIRKVVLLLKSMADFRNINHHLGSYHAQDLDYTYS